MSIKLKDIIYNKSNDSDKLDGIDSTSFAKTVKVGNTSYNANSSIISLPSYPTTLPNPQSLTIQANGISLGSYNGSSALSVNITYSNIGAAKTDHTHSQYYDSAISRTKNTVLAAPNGQAGTATFRALVAADIPSLAISKITNLQTTLDNKASSSSLSNYLPLAGGTMNKEANIYFQSSNTYGSSLWRVFAYGPTFQFKYGDYGSSSADNGSFVLSKSGVAYFEGSLGIGGSPEQKLHIHNGNIQISGSSSTSPTIIKNFLSDGNNYTTIGSEEYPFIINNTTGDVSIWEGDNGRQVSLARYGSIVFKTTKQGGWAMGSKVVSSDKTSIDAFICGALGDTNTLTYYYFGGQYSSPSMVIMPDGKVGVGTKTPSYLLHVYGNLGVGNIYNSYYNLISSNTNPYLKFINSSTNWYVQVYNKLLWLGSGATYHTGVSVDSRGGFTARSVTVIDSNTANTSYKSRWSFYGWDDTLSITKRNLTTNAYVDNVITVLYSSGNVGIGTTTPLDKLHVNGGITSTTTVKGINFTSTGAGSGTYNVGVITTNSTNGLEFEAPLQSDSSTAATRPITFSWRGGYANRYGMQLFGGGTNAYLTLTSSKTSIKFFAWDDGCTYIESGNTAFTANADLNITGTGGNTGSNLWLNMANIYCRGGKYVNIDSGNWSSYISTSASLSWPIKSPTTNNRHTEISTGGDILLRLDGNTGFAHGIGSYNTAGTCYGFAAGLYGNNTSLGYYFYGGTYDAPKAVILPNGNVGIGTTSPTFALEVNSGAIRATGYYMHNCDTSQSISARFGLYQWGNEVQFTKRTSSNVHDGTCMAIDLTSGKVNFDYGIKIGGQEITFIT